MEGLRSCPLWVIIQDIFENTGKPAIVKCKLCGKNEDCSSFANEVICKHIKTLHSDVVPYYTGKLKTMDPEYIKPFFIAFKDQFSCKICARLFKKSLDLRLMENHLRFNHKLNDTKLKSLANSPALNCTIRRRSPNTVATVTKRDGNNLMNNSKLENSSHKTLSNADSTIEENPVCAITEYYKKVGDSFECVFCKRQFLNKSDHILLCHISVAHPLFKRNGNINERENLLEDEQKKSVQIITEDVSEFFVKVNNRYQCMLCKYLFGSERHCYAHMKLQHLDILSKIEKKANILFEENCDASLEQLQAERAEKLKNLKYDPSIFTHLTTLKYTVNEKNQITCDFFDRLGDTMQCIICNMRIKTKTISPLIKHLRLSHSIFHTEKKNGKTNVIPEPSSKKTKLDVSSTETDLDGYDDPSDMHSDYVWNFFELMGDRTVVCMCCGRKFGKKSNITLLKHLQLIHPAIYSESNNELEPLSIAQKKQAANYPRKGKRLKSEKTLINFLISQGVSYDAVNDTNLHQIQFWMNRTASITNQDCFDTVIDELVESTKSASVTVFSFIACALDFVKEGNGVLFAISLHHFENSMRRYDSFFLRKSSSKILDEDAILDLIQNIMKENGYPLVMLKYIVIPENKKLFIKKHAAKKYVCGYTQIENFAEDIVDVLKSKGCIRALRDYVDEIRNNSSLSTRFELFQTSNYNSLDLTLSDCDNWLMAKDFIAECMEESNYDIMSTFARRWKMKKQVRLEYIEQLRNILRFLKELEEFGRVISEEGNTASMFIPFVKEIEKIIKKPENAIFRDVFEPAFDYHLRRIIENENPDTFSLATFFDARYSYCTSIYDQKYWQTIEDRLKDMLLKEVDTMNSFGTSIKNEQINSSAELNMMVSNFLERTRRCYTADDWKISIKILKVLIGGFINPRMNCFWSLENVMHEVPVGVLECFETICEKEILYYKELLETERPRNKYSCIFDWWKIHSNTMPILYKKAKENLVVPACVPDIRHYFGAKGKLSRLANTMSFRQLNNSLRVISKKEVARGAGCPIKYQMENMSETSNICEDGNGEIDEKSNNCQMQKPKTQRMLNHQDMNDEVDLNIEEMLMLPPPPVLEQMVDLVNMEVDEDQEQEINKKSEYEDSNFDFPLLAELKKEEIF